MLNNFMVKRVHAFFSGSVQGVGFRFTCRSLAVKFGITGWVKNRFDGRVELEAQGERDSLQGFLSDLKEEFKGHISDMISSDIPASSEEKEFVIVH